MNRGWDRDDPLINRVVAEHRVAEATLEVSQRKLCLPGRTASKLGDHVFDVRLP